MKPEPVGRILEDFKTITFESSFVVRTFFFVIFGMTISLSSLLSFNVFLVSILILIVLYAIRFAMLKLFIRKDINPQLYIAPRGLITILLFFAIPQDIQNSTEFEAGILLLIIIGTSLIMTYSLIKEDRTAGDKKPMDELILEEGESEGESKNDY